MFASGTAVIVSPIKNLEYKGENFPVHVDPIRKAGPLTFEIFENILGIQEGRV
ncbi:MAG: hypothetical protein H6605_11260 [Flavobacteriales bacterium]|nr:hypothetical protein [Flavobacteriales bacterium]